MLERYVEKERKSGPWLREGENWLRGDRMEAKKKNSMNVFPHHFNF